MTVRKQFSFPLFVALLVFGGTACGADLTASVKKKYGENCEIKQRCGNMMYVDCGAAVDGPAYYLDDKLEVLAPSGGLCMSPTANANCGAFKEWNECVGNTQK